VNKVRDFAAIVALSALVALPGCSMFGGGHEEAAATAAPPPAPAPAPAPTPPPTGNPEQNQMDHALVRQVQRELRTNRMYRGQLDGIWGPRTKQGVTDFQRKNNLPTTGELDDQTLQAMNLQPAGGGGTGMNAPPANENMGGGSMNSGAPGSTENMNNSGQAPAEAAPAAPAPAAPAPGSPPGH
jgi:peptidoglycan hydrolase-like protein with peptidoglycan-binding domain